MCKKLLNLAEKSRIWTLADSSNNGRSECRKYARGAPKRTRGHPRKVLMTKASSILPLAGDLKTLGLFLSLWLDYTNMVDLSDKTLAFLRTKPILRITFLKESIFSSFYLQHHEASDIIGKEKKNQGNQVSTEPVFAYSSLMEDR